MPVCKRYHSNEEDARSSFNIGFMKIIKGIDGMLKDKVNYNAWSKRVMVNTLIDEYRKNKTYSSHVQTKETETELDFHASSTANEGESSMGYENIMKLVDELPTVSAKVFNLYVIDGYSHKEIGDLLDMSEGTSKWHLSTARKMLREKLEILENNVKKMVI